MTLAGLFWAMAGDEDILARLIRKTLYVGFFAFLIGNFNGLCKVVYESFLGTWPGSFRLRLVRPDAAAARASWLKSASMPASRSSPPPAA